MSAKKAADRLIGQVVMVTTGEHRGVFAGVLLERDRDKQTATLQNARMCVSWDIATGGVLGLAGKGPGAGCRIGPAVPVLELDKINAYASVTPEAWKRWEAEPWTK